jgi:2-polyprenyl-3-methyl-5-hydroxy-6-metoxy-1,4-benzoquinol methylase
MDITARVHSPKEEEGYFTKTRPEMMEFVPVTAKKVLDIGCGAATFSAALKQERGAEVWGIEMDEEAAGLAAKRIDNVLVGDIATLTQTLPDGYFDCIVCNDVLEHLVDPYSVLALFKKKLAPGGVIVFSLPNVRYFGNLKSLLVHKDWKYEDEGILDRTHLRFFTKKSIERMFDEAGYKVTTRGITPLHSWKFWLLNALVLGNLTDTQFLQIAGVAHPKTS